MIRHRQSNKLCKETLKQDDEKSIKHVKIKRSWHYRVQEHMITKRRYFVLIGLLLGFTSVALLDIYYLKHDIPELIPAESMNAIKERFQLEWSSRIKEDLLASFDYRPLLASTLDRPGMTLVENNITAYSPVILIPGFTSTGLEIWKGQDCSKSYFRQRMWGTARMLQQFLLNQKCWLDHVMLNRTTGLDPDGIKLRPANGLEAADYVIGGYWVWGKIIENLADINYDSNNLFMAPFDWRLNPILLETRDKYFTKLKFMIEMIFQANENRKVVLIAHSYATQVIYYFLQWVESQQGGQGGDTWVDTYIESFINIAGPTLGTVKTISALLSGEMKDTAELGGLSQFLSFFFGPPARAVLARSWPSVFTMLPIGGEKIWGTMESAPDDMVSRIAIPENGETEKDSLNIKKHLHQHGSNGNILQFVNDSHGNLTMGQIRTFLGTIDSHLNDFHQWFENDDGPKSWTNPLATRLPNASHMKLFCLYGVGKPVERGYIYRSNPVVNDHDVPYLLHTEYQDLPWIKAGIRYSDGDGTVPLISLGFMCARGWRMPRYNPSEMQVTIREYQHNPVSMIYDPRGGPATSDHVDIMGNHDMIRDILHIVAKNYEQVPEQISSDIVEIAARVVL